MKRTQQNKNVGDNRAKTYLHSFNSEYLRAETGLKKCLSPRKSNILSRNGRGE